MMKCVFALALLHLCYGVALKREFIEEMIPNVNRIHELLKANQVTLNQTTKLYIPVANMKKNPGCCLGVFKRELTEVRKAVVSGTHSEGARLVIILEGHLDNFGYHAVNDTNCPLKEWKSKTMLGVYVDFLKTLLRSDFKCD